MNLPNWLSVIRIVCGVLLFPLAFFGQTFWFGLLFLLGGVTDFLDGFLARYLNQSSELGARLDSAGDTLMNLSLFLLCFVIPDFFWAHKSAFFLLYGYYILIQLLFWARFKRPFDLHLWLGKAAQALLFAFVVFATLLRPSAIFFWLTFATACLALTEQLVGILFRKSLTCEQRTVFENK